MLATVITPLLTYLLGGIPFGLIIAKLSGIEDIRKLGSGNIGATNVWRVAGAKVALWVFFFDIGKGVAAVSVAKLIFRHFNISMMSMELFLAICGIAAVLGHVFPVYLGFKGGKGVNTGLGVVATLLPMQTLISFVAFMLTLLLSRYVSLGSIIAVITLCSTLLIQKFGINQPVSTIYLSMAVILGVLVIFAHRKNILRIIDGTENRFSFSTQPSNAK